MPWRPAPRRTGRPCAGGDWHFRIEDNQGDKTDVKAGGSGLPSHGFYIRNGENIPVEYWYACRETNIYKYVSQDADGTLHVTDYPEWSWYSSLTPVNAYGPGGSMAAFPRAFHGQDNMRIANFQASDLYIHKEWMGEATAKEVFVKIWRKIEGGEPEDFTEIIARDVRDNQNWQAYVEDESDVDTVRNCLILKGDGPHWTDTLKVDNVLVGSLAEEQYYTYYIQEIGYRDLEGRVHTNANAKYKPLYYRVVELGDPAYMRASLAAEEIDGHKAVDDGTQTASQILTEKNTVTNTPERLDLELNKEWTGLGEGVTWPEGYVVYYQLVQHCHLARALLSEGEVRYTQGKTFLSVDMADSAQEAAASDQWHPQARGTLEAQNHNLVISGLPMYGFLTATAEDVTEAAKVGVTLTEGTVYPVVYTYSARETAVKKNGTDVSFNPQTVEAVKKEATGNVYTATLTNELTEIEVEKKWQDESRTITTDEHDGDTVNLTLYALKTLVVPPEPERVKVYINTAFKDSIDDSDVSGMGTITVLVDDEEALTLSSANGWRADEEQGNYILLEKDGSHTITFVKSDEIVSLAPTTQTIDTESSEAVVTIDLAAKVETKAKVNVKVNWNANPPSEADARVTVDILDKDNNDSLIRTINFSTNYWSESVYLPKGGSYKFHFSGSGTDVASMNEYRDVNNLQSEQTVEVGGTYNGQGGQGGGEVEVPEGKVLLTVYGKQASNNPHITVGPKLYDAGSSIDVEVTVSGWGGTPVTGGEATFNDRFYTVTAEGNPATVADPQTVPEVTVKNNTETVDIDVTKTRSEPAAGRLFVWRQSDGTTGAVGAWESGSSWKLGVIYLRRFAGLTPVWPAASQLPGVHWTPG